MSKRRRNFSQLFYFRFCLLSPTFVMKHNDLYETLTISCTSAYALHTVGSLPWFSFRKYSNDSSPIILVCKLSSHSIRFPGLLECFIHSTSNRHSPMVGPSVGALGLEANVDNFIISSETDDNCSLGDEWSMSESLEIDILLEK